MSRLATTDEEDTVSRLRALRQRAGKFAEAKAATARVMELQPNFSISRQLAGVDCEKKIGTALTKALSVLGLPV
ncbi:MAG: hypothetical protein C5B56_08495 [Proteobacteria bacterium]|nr:MAG: hypothetical protein C5B56_08495 [Pseudomonadota bacterium]